MNLNATIFFQMVVFFILGLATMVFVWPNLIKVIDERRKKISDGLSAAEKSIAELSIVNDRVKLIADNAKKEAHERISNAERQVSDIIDKAKSDAESERSKIIAQAQQDTEIIIRNARDLLREDVAILAIKGAEQILRREVDLNEHRDILDRLKSEL
ncbi:F-type H+-transporting ATPase subunit b [Candidatus Kinetoplastibacterium blastocrithidii TCC012E]|uniref:ATP synthase subunit b n=1 Tax=Candidatus Kinetoplastidibacterium blastocrithidiae TCC012E TaxID=1208922 RepID=M1LVC4_9PROT|nr:F0F1 ATP synthase subunit B [Candidatus Kinetoplastibacterium blastocrithidii]AGF49502.1 F-type H+-transporting ATPase subunit b [Candidatus Kinetoplastibacterium blastocrithidii TCC012E]